MNDEPDVIQVVFSPALREALEKWLASRGLALFPVPVEDDLPTYFIGHAPDAAP